MKNSSLKTIFYFVGSMQMNMVLDERKAKLVKIRSSSSEVINLCARIRSTDNSFLDIFNKDYIHCEMSSDRVSQNFTSYLCKILKEKGKLYYIISCIHV